MIVLVIGEGKGILEIAYDSPHFLRRERNLHKLHMLDHDFGEGKEILEIAYDSPRF